MNTKYYLFVFIIIILLLTFINCGQNNSIIGLVHVTGKITNIDSNNPIANTIVQLYKVDTRGEPDGHVPYRTDVIVASDTTDASGNYSITYNAVGEFGFEVVAEPNNPFYASSDYSYPQNSDIDKAGSFSIDLSCYRSGYAKIMLTNVTPIDTPLRIYIYFDRNSKAPVSYSLFLYNFFKDTLVFYKLAGLPDKSYHLHMLKTGVSGLNNIVTDYNINLHPWDTTTVQFNY